MAAAAPLAVAAALTPWRSTLDTADSALVLVVVVVAVASGTGRRTPAALAAVSAALSFDFLLTRPYESLRIVRHQDLVTEILLVVVGLAVGELTARGRRHRTVAEAGEETLSRLHSVTELAASGREPHEVVEAARLELSGLLGLRSCSFTRHDPGRLPARITAAGELMVGNERWSGARLGLPTGRVDLPVRANGWLLGHFVLTPRQGQQVRPSRLLAAVALADQVGAVLLAEDTEGQAPAGALGGADPAPQATPGLAPDPPGPARSPGGPHA